MVVVQSKIKKMTYAEFRYLEIPDGDTSIYELINGIIMRRSSPHSEHQIAQSNIFLSMGSFVRDNSLGRVLAAPLDVVFSDNNSVQPDLLFIKKDSEKIIERGGPVWGCSPNLIVEIISKGTAQHDRKTKKKLYEKFGVKEYWIVDPKSETVEVFVLENSQYVDFDFAEVGVKNSIKSQVLTNFELDIAPVFE